MTALSEDIGRSSETAGIAALLEQVSRIVQAMCFADGMHPVQWSALRYFSKAGANARTVSGLANYQGTTLPPASRTVAALVKKGYLEAIVDPRDRRSRRIDLTDEGSALIGRDPIHALEQAIADLPAERRQALTDSLEAILAQLGERGTGRMSRSA
jgi:DNA-binding MarR family transcriptional regulator